LEGWKAADPAGQVRLRGVRVEQLPGRLDVTPNQI